MQRAWVPYAKPVYAAIIAALTKEKTGGRFPDFSSDAVILPGRQWLRNLQEALVAAFPDGLCPPRLLTPGSALNWELPEERRTADGEQLQVLKLLLREIGGRPEVRTLLPERENGWTEQDFAEAAEQFLTLRQELVRNGRTVREAAEILADRDARWHHLAGIEERFQEKLRQLGVPDPAEVQQQALDASALAERFDRIFIAFVPDLPRLLQQKLEPLADRITVLIHADSADSQWFDDWGRPLLEWNRRQLPIAEGSLHAAADPHQAARLAIRLAADARGGTFDPETSAVVLGRSSFFPALEYEFGRLEYETGGNAELFSPEGIAGSALRIGSALQPLCRLLKDPDDFNAALETLHNPDWLAFLLHAAGTEQQAGENQFLALLDQFTVETLPERIAAAVRNMTGKFAPLQPVFRKLKENLSGPVLTAEFVSGLKKLLETVFEKPDYPAVYGVPFEDERIFWRDNLDALLHSPVLALLPDAAEKLQYLLDECGRRRFFPKRNGREIAVYNLLELAALPQRQIILIGMNGGIVPAVPGITPFLNDTARAAIGLPDTAALQALETCRLYSLLQSGREIHLVALEMDETASPLYPAGVLFQKCSDAELIRRVALCRTAVPVEDPAGPAAGDGTFQLDFSRIAETGFFRKDPFEFAVTAFRDYLASPRAFLLKQAFKADWRDYGTREMGENDFGTACHAGFERLLGQNCTGEAEFLQVLQGGADAWLKRHYGEPLPLLIRLQQQQIHARLEAAAKYLARMQMQEGEDWKLLETEYPLNGNEGVRFGGALIRGTIDRIEYSPSRNVLRLVDVKTYDSATRRTPENGHLKGPRNNRVLMNLQLPLYERLLRLDGGFWRKHELEPAAVTFQAGYLVLTGDGEEPALLLWGKDFADYCEKAEAVVRRVVNELTEIRDHGRLPPEPGGRTEYYQLAPLFLPDAGTAVRMEGC